MEDRWMDVLTWNAQAGKSEDRKDRTGNHLIIVMVRDEL